MNPESTDWRAEVSHLDQQIAAQQAEAVAAHRAFVAADAALRGTIARRDALVSQHHAAAPQPAWIPDAPTLPAPPAVPPPSATTPGTAPGAVPETSTRTVQNVLFILGGLLLGTAAIVFTAVAWTTFGVQGRAAILGVITLITLAAPIVALARKLRATAETFAAIALLLVGLDGYAAWYVNLFGAQTLSGLRYAGVVALAVALVGLGYRMLTRLVGPAFVALVAVQPVLPLLLAPEPLSDVGWSLMWSAVAVVNLGVAWLTRSTETSRPGALPTVPRAICRVMSLVLYGLWLAVAAIVALVADLVATSVADRAQAGGALVVAAAVFAASTRLYRSALLARAVGVVVVVLLAVAVNGVVTAAWPGRAMLLAALVALGAALAAATTRRILPAQMWPGPAIGASLVAGGVGLLVGAAAVYATVQSIATASPLWSAALASTGPHPPLATWQLPVAVVALALAAAALLPRHGRIAAAAYGSAVAILVLPASFSLVWWAPAVLSLSGAAIAAAVLVVGRPGMLRVPAGVSALVLALDAVLIAGARPALSAAVLGAVCLLGLAVAAFQVRVGAQPSAVAGTAFGIALVALPAAVGSTLVAADVTPWWAARGTVITVGVLVLALNLLRGSRVSTLTSAGYRAVLIGAFVWPTVAAVTGESSPSASTRRPLCS
jgi:hypothetical protein